MIPPPPKLPSTCWVGIDPGFSGAIALLDGGGRYLACWDMPVRGESGRSQEIDTSGICNLLPLINAYGPDVRVRLEWPQTRPDESPESSKRFGVGLGILEGVFTAHGYPPVRVAPNDWKGRLGLAGKERDPLAARTQAVNTAMTFIRGLPGDHLHGPKGGLLDGRAEALLIAWEGLTRTREGLLAQPADVRMARMLFGSSRFRRSKGREI